MCVVASPPNGACENWRVLCPEPLPLVVADIADVDDFHTKLCPSLWKQGKICDSGSRRTYRLVSAPPVLVRQRLVHCPVITVPWLSHARSPDAAVQHRERTVRIAFAGGITGHVLARRRGFERWRRYLRDACHGMGSQVLCTAIYQSLAGSMARGAIELYARSIFCLQPPGDTLVRTGIVDAISVGCIPVFFHAAQRRLWPQYWHAPAASVLFDWSQQGASLSPANATSALRALIDIPDETVLSLQAAAGYAARRIFYRGEIGPVAQSDATDVLVESLWGL